MERSRIKTDSFYVISVSSQYQYLANFLSSKI